MAGGGGAGGGAGANSRSFTISGAEVSFAASGAAGEFSVSSVFVDFLLGITTSGDFHADALRVLERKFPEFDGHTLRTEFAQNHLRDVFGEGFDEFARTRGGETFDGFSNSRVIEGVSDVVGAGC